MKLSVIILSYTTTDGLFEMTSNCIHSLIKSETSIDFEIILIESNKNFIDSGFVYPESVKVIIPDSDFNFHKFLNIGIKESKGEFVALCNNDLIFCKNWFSNILKVYRENPSIKSFSPCDKIKNHDFVSEIELGYKVRTHIMGWCIVVRKNVFSKIGFLDETFDFNYADNDYAMTLKKFNIRHALVNSSKVEHLEPEKSKDKKEGLGHGYNKLLENVNIDLKSLPDYIFENDYFQYDKKSLEDCIKYHNKWGKPSLLYRKNKIADLCIRFHLGFLNWIIL